MKTDQHDGATVDLEIDGGRGIQRDEGRIGDWMQTWSGRRFYPADPRAEDVDIIDIAFALGNISRYGGHSRRYSVAEHSVEVSKMVPAADAFAGLMHDATEAYLTDVIRPVKRILGRSNQYFELEQKVWAAIAERFQLPAALPDSVHTADVAICMAEQRALFPRAQAWDFGGMPFPQGVHIACHTPSMACARFLSRFSELSGQNLDKLMSRFVSLQEEDDRLFYQGRDLAS